MSSDENLVLNSIAASPQGASALAIAWAACARPLQIADMARTLHSQGLLRRRDEAVEVYETLGTTPLATGLCFACASSRVKAPAVVCDRCMKKRSRAPLLEIEAMASFVGAPGRALNLADIAARTRANASEVDTLLLAWTQARIVAFDHASVDPAWVSPGAERFAAAGELARIPRAKLRLSRRAVVALCVMLFASVVAFNYAHLRQARKAAASRYWNLKSALGEHEQLIAPLVQGIDSEQLRRSVGLAVQLDLDKHVKRAKTMNDLVAAEAKANLVTIEPFTKTQVDAFDSTFSASLADYNAHAAEYLALRKSVMGRVLCSVSRCTVFDPQASPF